MAEWLQSTGLARAVKQRDMSVACLNKHRDLPLIHLVKKETSGADLWSFEAGNICSKDCTCWAVLTKLLFLNWEHSSLLDQWPMAILRSCLPWLLSSCSSLALSRLPSVITGLPIKSLLLIHPFARPTPIQKSFLILIFFKKTTPPLSVPWNSGLCNPERSRVLIAFTCNMVTSCCPEGLCLFSFSPALYFYLFILSFLSHPTLLAGSRSLTLYQRTIPASVPNKATMLNLIS